MKPTASLTTPLLACWDTAAAFPSLQHCFIWTVFRQIMLPSGILNFFLQIYQLNSCMVMGQLAYFITTGALQGCPLSGFVYSVVTSPFVSKLQTKLDVRFIATTRVCADDIGAVMDDMASLKVYKSTFDTMACCAGLKLKPPKCILVPLWRPFSVHVASLLRDVLSATIPEWGSFKIEATVKYLGLTLGPASDEHSWASPIAKWKARSIAFARSGSSVTVATKLHNSRAIPTLLYVSQFVPPPRAIAAAANAHANALWHLPPNAITAQLLERIKLFGGLDMLSPLNSCKASLVRAAAKTFDWKTPLTLLRAALHDDANNQPMLRQMHDLPWPSWWAAPPISWSPGRIAEGTYNLGGDAHAHELCEAFTAARNSSAPQRVAYAFLQKSFNGIGLQEFIKARLLKHFPDFHDVIHAANWGSFKKALKRADLKTSHSVIKSWIGAWTTSTRMREERPLSCMGGCTLAPGTDSWKHYATCSCWWMHSTLR